MKLQRPGDENVKIHPFSYAYYRHMLKRATEAGYRVSSFVHYSSDYPQTIILRHDVDYTMDGLITLARIEAELGCTATYCLRVHSDEYNLFACSTWATVDSIRRMGHELGLHFEAANVGRALGLDPAELLIREKAVLEAILGQPVVTCSEHRELSGTIHGTPLYEQLHSPLDADFTYYAMDAKYCRDMKYLSDSNAHWREGDLLEHLGRHDRLQVLVHPDWWFAKDMLLKGPYYHPRSTHT
jgi:hypothetical protein